MKALIAVGDGLAALAPLAPNVAFATLAVHRGTYIEHLIGLLSRHSITSLGLVGDGPLASLRAYLGDGSRLGASLDYFDGLASLGTPSRPLSPVDFVDEESFLLITGDVMADINLDKAIEFHYRNRAWATVVAADIEAATGRGTVICDEDGRVHPRSHKQMACSGIYILRRELLAALGIGEGCPINLDSVLRALRDAGSVPVFCYYPQANLPLTVSAS